MKQILPVVSEWKVMHAEPWLGPTAGCSALPLAERWVPAQVPGDVHLDYERAGLIADPFFGTNHDLCRWMEDWDWWYRSEVTPPVPGPGQRLHLLFEGLDVFATVYLNGREIGRHQNMFTPLRVDVTEQVRPGSNRLEVCLGSPVMPPGRLPSPEVRGYGSPLRLQVRKAQSCYGWNITPRLVTIGIWKPVAWLLVDEAEIADVSVSTVALLPDGTAVIEALVELETNHGVPGPVEVQLTVAGRSRQLTLSCDTTGGRHVERFTVPQAQLWWPHNHGSQPLYEWSAVLRCGGRELDRRSGRFGIRTVDLIQEPAADGTTSFIVAINGRKIFLKGMNWTPVDAIYARINDARYRELLHATKAANINALRVWGGGIYEHDSFYAQCDELGILVIHDFMFACGCYPQDAAFLDEARREAVFQVRRLRHYACVVAWFGDNENDVLADNSFNYPAYRHNRLSKEVLRDVVHAHAPLTPYVPTSPYSPTIYDQNSPREGDCHIWGHGLSYRAELYTGQRPRMVTEIGHMGMPDIEVIERFVSPDQRWPIWNEEYLTHGSDCTRLDRCGLLRTLFQSIQARGWEEPQSLADLITKSQQLHSEASQFWIEFYAGQPECWGIFLWSLADCWPQISPAYIAYPFHPKPALAAVQAAYARVQR
jgi:beta-mannosidase